MMNKNKNVNMKYCNFYITVKQYEKFKEMSKDTGLSYSEIIRRALDMYIENKEK